MRKRRNKFALDFGDGVEVQTMEEFVEHFNFKKVMEYFKNRRLIVWLEDRFYSDEADAIRALKPADPNAPQKICEVLGIDYAEYSEELDDPETVAWRAERRERLRQYTDDEKIIKKVDYVAFDQDDLEDILRDPFLPNVIYLCDNFFLFPSGMLRKTNLEYIGLGKVTVKIETQKQPNFRALNISFKNVKFAEDESAVAEGEQTEENQNEEKISATENKLPTIRLSDTQIVLADFIPSAAVTQTAMRFKSRISIRHEGKFIDAKSVNMLKVRGFTKGVRVTVNAEGFDAAEAIKTFAELWQKGWKKNNQR